MQSTISITTVLFFYKCTNNRFCNKHPVLIRAIRQFHSITTKTNRVVAVAAAAALEAEAAQTAAGLHTERHLEIQGQSRSSASPTNVARLVVSRDSEAPLLVADQVDPTLYLAAVIR